MTLALRMLAALIMVVWGDGSSDYEAARARAGGGPDGHIKLALWCERHGLQDERGRNLALAVEQRPDGARARGLLGMVRLDGHWREAAEAAAGPIPEALAHYNARREAIDPQRAEDHWQLALWCERHGLRPEARAHLAAVVRLEPSREAAWRHMGFRQHHGRWMTPEQIEAAIVEAKARREADKHWGPELERLRTRIQRGGPAAQEAEANLADVRDPRAVPKLWEVFVLRSRHAEDHARAVGVLERIDSHEATLRLVRLAVSSPSQPVSTAAAAALMKRDPREVIGALIDSRRAPVAFQVVAGQGVVVGELQVEGRAFNLERFYVLREEYNPLFELNAQPVTRSTMGFGLTQVTRTTVPMRAVADYGAARRDAMAALNRDLALLGRFNASILDSNQRIDALLRDLTGQDVGRDPLLKEALARVDVSHEERLRAGREARERSRQAQQELIRQQGDLMNRVSEEMRQLGMASRMATTPQEMAAAGLQMSALSAQNRDMTAAYMAEFQARQQQQATEPALQAGWEQNRVQSEREEARNESWRRWWDHERGYSSDEPGPPRKRTIVQVRSFEIPVVVLPGETTTTVGRTHNSCFAGGTPVHTRTGCRPIEDLQIGDLVLSRDTATGALEYRPVTAIYHRRPSPTYRVVIGGESLIATGIHRFWKAGAGWTMARDLKPGDPIRTVDGIRTVELVQPDVVRPVYNLDVDRTRSFLVGRAGALVHDDGLPEPVVAAFDAVPELVVARDAQ